MPRPIALLLLAAAAAAAAACRPAPPVAPSDERIARLERRLDKLIAYLEDVVPPTLDDTVTYAIPVDPLDPVLGPATAPVTLVEAYELLCPYCAQVAPTIDELRRRYPADVRVVSKYYVIHGEAAVPAGKASCAAARQGKYAPMKQAMWGAIWPEDGAPDREQATAAAIDALAQKVGLDMDRFRADVAGPCATWLEATQAVLGQFGAPGTPAFYLNGRYVQAKTVDDLVALVDAELARVRGSKVAPARYYADVVMATGKPRAVMVSPFAVE